jgi:hypothetical protein
LSCPALGKRNLSESPSGSSWADVVAETFIRVTPKEIADGPFARNLLEAIKFPDVIKSFDAGGEASMSAKNLSFDNSCERKVVKEFSEHLPNVVVFVLPHALIIEPVVLGDTSRLVVASENGESFFESYLEAEKETNSLNRVIASIDIISEEEVVGVRDVASDFEELHKVIKLSVYVSADVDRGSYIDHIGFFGKDFPDSHNPYFALSHKTLISCSLRSLH